MSKFIELVNESVNDGYSRGIDLFMENLETDLAKCDVISEAGGIDAVVAAIMEEEEVIEEETAKTEEAKTEEAKNSETIDENAVVTDEDEETDKLLAELEKDGI